MSQDATVSEELSQANGAGKTHAEQTEPPVPNFFEQVHEYPGRTGELSASELPCGKSFDLQITHQRIQLRCTKPQSHPGVHGTELVSEGNSAYPTKDKPNPDRNADAGKRVKLTWR